MTNLKNGKFTEVFIKSSLYLLQLSQFKSFWLVIHQMAPIFRRWIIFISKFAKKHFQSSKNYNVMKRLFFVFSARIEMKSLLRLKIVKFIVHLNPSIMVPNMGGLWGSYNWQNLLLWKYSNWTMYLINSIQERI